MNFLSKWMLLLLALTPYGFAAESDGTAPKKPLQVIALHPLLGELAPEIGGPRVEVVNLLQPGEDPHLFQPRPADMRKVSQADLILAGGLDLEPYLGQLRDGAGARASWLLIGDSLPSPIEGTHSCSHDQHDDHDHDHHDADHADHDHHHGESEFDPHWWHSVGNMKHAAGQVRARLSELSPEDAALFTQREEALQDRLEELDHWVRREVARIPRERRILVTSHQAFAYLGHDYGFDILPLVGTSTSEQPSSGSVRELVETLREKNVHAIFAEDRENSRVLEQILQETGARNGGTLYADGPGADEASTYEAMMRHNISTIVSALQ